MELIEYKNKYLSLQTEMMNVQNQKSNDNSIQINLLK